MSHVCYLTNLGGNNNSTKPNQKYPEQIAIVPHARTIRNAREQVRLMVIDGFSIPQIRSYLSAWSRWWVRTSQSWTLLTQFIHSCYDVRLATIAAGLINDCEMAGSGGLTAPDLQETA